MYTVALFFMKFLLFSMLGYVTEMITCAIVERRFTNRGFLCGPVIPVYGVGSMALIILLKPIKDNIILLALLGMLITSIVEYLTGFWLEKIFHNKWWDYSNEKYNLNGYVCLKNVLLFGVSTPIVVKLIDPYLTNMILELNDKALILISFLCFVVFFIDVVYSVIIAYNLRHRLIIVESLKKEKLAKIPGMLEKMLNKRLKKLKKYPKRLLSSFPNLLKSNEKEFELMKKISITEKNKRKKAKKKKKNSKKKKK